MTHQTIALFERKRGVSSTERGDKMIIPRSHAALCHVATMGMWWHEVRPHVDLVQGIGGGRLEFVVEHSHLRRKTFLLEERQTAEDSITQMRRLA